MTIALLALAALGALALALIVLTFAGAAWIDARYRATGTRVPVEGAHVHCMVWGKPSPDRPSLLFVHGASSNHREFMIALAEHRAGVLGGDQHAIFVDRPGQGSSTRLPGDHCPHVQAQRLLAAARALGAPSVVAVGHSWGGAVVAQMAVDGADFVAGAVFVAPATHPWPGDRFEGVDWFYAVASWPVIGWLFTRMVALPAGWFQVNEGVEDVFAPEPPKPGYAAALGARLVLRPMAFRANARDVYRLRRFVIAHAPAYKGISCPVRILTGDEDGVVWPHIHSDGLERDIPGARKTVIAGGGHMPHQTHPALLLDLIGEVMAVR